MNKIGILNFQYSNHNYGAVLQAAALEYTCRQLGHLAHHLDYKALPKASLRGQIGQLLRKLGLRKTPHSEPVENREAFERFRVDFISRTERILTAEDFALAVKGFDSVIVGSDQVWRPTFANDAIVFFLGYVPKGIKRIAYAASFGNATWDKQKYKHLTKRIGDELRQFKAISCREDSGVEICRSVFAVECVHVLDPLLLVEESFFSNIIAKSSVYHEAKLVHYNLDSSADLRKDLENITLEIGGDLTNIYMENNGVRKYREVSDWLTLILKSETVITDSYHCICLALRFGKNVIYCPNKRRGESRMVSLFGKLNIAVEPLAIPLKTPMYKLITNGDVAAILKREREKSMKYLSDALIQ